MKRISIIFLIVVFLVSMFGTGSVHAMNTESALLIGSAVYLFGKPILRSIGNDLQPGIYQFQYSQPRQQIMNCYGFVNEDIWGTDKYGNRYVQYTQQRQIQIPCP
jgi:hypothetical protein